LTRLLRLYWLRFYGAELFESGVDVAPKTGGQKRQDNRHLQRFRVAQAVHVIHAQRSVPVAKEQLHFPSDPNQLCAIAGREDLARQTFQCGAIRQKARSPT
jgi:hypothetical protein